MKYDIFKHGIGTKVLNVHTKEIGIVQDIKEIAYEYIVPYVKYGSKEAIREYVGNLEVINVTIGAHDV